MRIRTLAILQKFLEDYQHLRRTGVFKSKIDMDWRFFFSRAELEEALKMKFHDAVSLPLDFSSATSADMLVALEDDLFLLDYILKAWKDLIDPNVLLSPSKEALVMVLDQLCLETHYLKDKDFDSFDEYDLSNMRALFRKAGWMVKVYAVVKSDEVADDFCIARPPKCYYDSYGEAHQELTRQTREEGFSKDKLRVITKEMYLPPF
jgi:hypothetical protein